MKALKIAAILVVVYACAVAAFESLIGFLQPADASTLVLVTFDETGTPHERVVSRLDSDGRVYVSANHWPRAWYTRALEHPDVQATIDGRKGNYRAVPVTGAEAERVEGEHPHGLWFRILTGFPPRRFVRLDPS
jgi:hypothetical protein